MNILFEAILKLSPNANFYVENGKVTWNSPDIEMPPQSDIDAEVTKLQADYDAKKYQRDRLKEYPDLQECIHAILDDDLTSLQAKRKIVKEKYPKPE